MGKTRISFSLDPELLQHFDRWVTHRGYTNRSEAFRDLIRELLIDEAWDHPGRDVAAVVVLVYAHPVHHLSETLIAEEHRHHHLVLARTHVHLDRHNCLEVVLLRGPAREVEALAHRLITRNEVKFGRLVRASTGQDLP